MSLIFDPSNPLYKILLAVALGVFIGLRRETARKQRGNDVAKDILGIRTTSLIIILGVVSTLFSGMPWMMMFIFASVLVFLIIAYINGVWRLGRYGLTAEISGILMFLIGVLVGLEHLLIAILLSVLLGVSSAYKSRIHLFAQQFSLTEWSGTLQLVVISAIILPLLPKTSVDPYGVIVPFDIWVLVIFISGIGFVGYFFTKYLGEKKSILFTSFFGALASSTATTVAFARQSAAKVGLNDASLLLVGVMVSICVMQLRVVVEVVIFAHTNQVMLATPSLAMAVVSAVFGVMYFLRHKKGGSAVSKSIRKNARSPFEIMPALGFGALFVVVLIAIHVGKVFFGDAGVYVSAFLASFADVDAVVFSSLISYGEGTISGTTAANAIVLAAVINTFVKLLYIYFFGSRSFFWKSVLPIMLISISGVVAIFLL